MFAQVMTKFDGPNPPELNGVDAVLKARREALAAEVESVLMKKGWSLQQAELQTGIPASTIARLKKGANVKPATILAFAAKVGGDQKRWERIAAGQPPDEDYLSRVGVPVNIERIRNIPHHAGYASADPAATVQAMATTDGFLSALIPSYTRSIEVRGDCMLPFYQSGDILLVREAEDAKPGEKVIALVDNDTLACKVFRKNGSEWLEPTNGEGKIEAGRFKVVGVVDALLRPERASPKVHYPH